MEAIILAGGLGTRLSSVISNVPKPMAPVAGRPFLSYLLRYLRKEGIRKVILSTGYMHEKVEEYFHQSYAGVSINYARETEPLGTGGAIKKAIAKVEEETVVVLNGDSYFDLSIKDLIEKHLTLKADVTLALKPLINYERYGTVFTRGDQIIGFVKKGFRRYGKINGGVYVLRRSVFDQFQLPEKFGIEEFFEDHINDLTFGAMVSDTYFIDIGVPEDYQKVQKELAFVEG